MEAMPAGGVFEFAAATKLIVGPGTLARLGGVAQALGGSRALVVSDPGIAAAGHTTAAIESLSKAGLDCLGFHELTENPTTDQVAAGAAVARDFRPDLLVAVGGGSSMDCAKAINFLSCCGGRMQDYRGRGRATGPLLPSIAVPTTSGTGSETQSFALVSDATTGEKMACGDPRVAFRVAILDVLLTLTQPRTVTALTGIDAAAHAVESFVSTAATPASRIFSREAWRLLTSHLPRVLADGSDVEARAAVQLAAAWAGIAIENAMLGAAHALANPLTQCHRIAHGQAVGMMLPHVVRFNAPACGAAFGELCHDLPPGDEYDPPCRIAAWLTELLRRAGLATSLTSLGLADVNSRSLAAMAATQWTGTFNPRPVAEEELATLYEAAR